MLDSLEFQPIPCSPERCALIFRQVQKSGTKYLRFLIGDPENKILCPSGPLQVSIIK